jgi:hypothetical protein
VIVYEEGVPSFFNYAIAMGSSIYSTQIRPLCEGLNPIASMTFSSVLTSDRKTQETPDELFALLGS